MTNYFFDELNKKVQEGAERWKKIDALAKELEEIPGPITRMLLLLVEEMRPMGNPKEQVEEFQKTMNDMLKNLEGKK